MEGPPEACTEKRLRGMTTSMPPSKKARVITAIAIAHCLLEKYADVPRVDCLALIVYFPYLHPWAWFKCTWQFLSNSKVQPCPAEPMRFAQGKLREASVCPSR